MANLRSNPALLLILLILPLTLTTAVNVTAILSAYPSFSAFTRLLSSTTVAVDLTDRSSLTLLAVPDSYLLLKSNADVISSSSIADVIRYHVLLEYFSWPDLDDIPVNGGRLVATLYQTTGRAIGDFGAVNLTRTAAGKVYARSPVPFSSSNATLLSLVKTLPYNVSIFSVDNLLVPYDFDLETSASRPPPFGLNITSVLIDGKEFNVAASMLEASGVVEEFESDENGAGITMFVPTDDAFANLPVTERFQSLTADLKAVVLRYHVLHSYYPLGSLESIVNPLQPTLSTEHIGAGTYTLNITRVNGSVAIDTGIVQASITRTVFDHNPVAVFAVSRVLLPPEIFLGHVATNPLPPPSIPALSPETPPARVSTPPGMKGEVRSGVDSDRHGLSISMTLCLLYLVTLVV